MVRRLCDAPFSGSRFSIRFVCAVGYVFVWRPDNCQLTQTQPTMRWMIHVHQPFSLTQYRRSQFLGLALAFPVRAIHAGTKTGCSSQDTNLPRHATPDILAFWIGGAVVWGCTIETLPRLHRDATTQRLHDPCSVIRGSVVRGHRCRVRGPPGGSAPGALRVGAYKVRRTCIQLTLLLLFLFVTRAADLITESLRFYRRYFYVLCTTLLMEYGLLAMKTSSWVRPLR